MSEYLVTIRATFDIVVDAENEESARRIALNTDWDDFDDCVSEVVAVEEAEDDDNE